MQTESRIKFIWLCRGAAHLRVSKDTAPETRCQVFGEIILWFKYSKGLTRRANRIEDTQYSVLSWLLSIRVYCKENSYLYILYIYNIYRYNLSYALFRFCFYSLNTEYWVTCHRFTRRPAYQGGTFFIYTKAMGFPEHCEIFGIFGVCCPDVEGIGQWTLLSYMAYRKWQA